MRGWLKVVLAALGLVSAGLGGAGCSRQGGDSQGLVAEVKRRLAARQERLTSYVLAGTVREQQQALEFQFAYRSPKWMLGRLLAPASRTVAWDGERLYEQEDSARRFTTFRDELPAARRAGLLTEVFAPFSPEGFRAPLLPGQGLEVRRGPHPRAPQAVELVMRPEQGLEVVYVLRWPSMDFLAKRTRSGEQRAELRVEQEHCDPALELCVPQRLTQWAEGQQVGETVLSKVELNPTLPADTFSLRAPEGYQREERTLVEAEAR